MATRQLNIKRILFVSWTPHTRARDLSARLGATYFVPAPFARTWWWPLRYAIQFTATILKLLTRKPDIVLFTNPPFIAGAACVVATAITRGQCWADCHSGAYNDPRWRRFARLNRFILSCCTGAIFHNDMLAAREGDAASQSLVLSVYAMDDRSTLTYSCNARGARSRPVVIGICSFAFDEPIEAIIEAANQIPAVDFLLTGNWPPDLVSHLPSNMQLTGWLSDEAFHRELSEAAAVVCLTTREATMQNGIIEGLEHKRPVVTSDSQALREWARDIPGVLTVRNTGHDLARSISTIIEDPAYWNDKAAEGHSAARLRADAELARFSQAVDA